MENNISFCIRIYDKTAQKLIWLNSMIRRAWASDALDAGAFFIRDSGSGIGDPYAQRES